ncbi:MAG TPA: hypothetical protein VL017_04445, partial [Devosia sp.]|nr:hypothetical protein [Devosia sp.]
MGAGQSSRLILLERAAEVARNDASFARFFKAAVLATDGEDLGRQAPDQFEAALQRSYRHLLAYSGDSSQLTITP